MTTLQNKLKNQLESGLQITQTNNRLWIDGEVLNTKTLVSYIRKTDKRDYRIVLKELVTIL